jgi:hypothetical protein
MWKKANIKDAVDAARSNWPITNISVKIKQVRMAFTVFVNVAVMRKRPKTLNLRLLNSLV